MIGWNCAVHRVTILLWKSNEIIINLVALNKCLYLFVSISIAIDVSREIGIAFHASPFR